MMRRLSFVLLIIILPIRQAGGQAIGLIQRDAFQDRGLLLQYENDAFGNTDYYYSQGVSLIFTHPELKKNPLTKLLPGLKNSVSYYGLNLEHDAYTPTSILSDSILRGDRPYAASFFIQSFRVSTNSDQHIRLTTALALGLIGPAAGGKEIQTLIHRNTRNNLPHGWEHQIANDAIVNYTAIYERGIFNLNFLSATGLAGIDLGTYQDKGYAGVNMKLGLMNDPIFGARQRAVQFYAEVRARGFLVGYDASLQGGLFNRKSPYIIPSSAISRFTFRNDFACYLTFKQLTVSASYTTLSKEFETGRKHAWGAVMAGLSF